VALKFGKTTGEIWMERLAKAFLSGLVLFAHALVFVMFVAKSGPSIGLPLSVALCILAWQGVCRVVTGGLFRFRLVVSNTGNACEMFDVVFTVIAILNTALFVYFVAG
jgi:hypothetical protein